MFGIKNLMIDIEGAKIPCAVFGKGKKNLIMLPGLGDGLATVKGKALPMAFMYKEFMNDFTVFIMSRREPMRDNFSTKDMAADVALFMERMGIEDLADESERILRFHSKTNPCVNPTLFDYGKTFESIDNPLPHSDAESLGYSASLFFTTDGSTLFYGNNVDGEDGKSKIVFAKIKIHE